MPEKIAELLKHLMPWQLFVCDKGNASKSGRINLNNLPFVFMLTLEIEEAWV
jgi:hypothetical protein